MVRCQVMGKVRVALDREQRGGGCPGPLPFKEVEG